MPTGSRRMKGIPERSAMTAEGIVLPSAPYGTGEFRYRRDDGIRRSSRPGLLRNGPGIEATGARRGKRLRPDVAGAAPLVGKGRYRGGFRQPQTLPRGDKASFPSDRLIHIGDTD